MTKDKWLNVRDMVEVQFGIDKEYKESVGEDIPGEKQVIEFEGPMGKMKLEWVEKARLKDVKTIYSDRIGSDVKINKEYDKDEKVNYMNAYKWNETTEEWEEIKGDMFE